MANKRTVDPTASEASSRIVGIRMTDTQLRQIEELCVKHGTKRSVLIRDLIRHAYNEAFMPEAF
jgi:metal-responsive CopG/Arc/MetJ family transcriptional regulator